MIDLYAVNLDKVQALVPDLYHDVLNTHEKQQVNRQKVESVRSQRILSRGFLRLVLSQKTNKHAQDIQLHTGKHGKPYLGNNSLYFNVSHTKNILVLALSTQYEVGIDIEYKDINIQAENMPKQCFHPQEWKYFQQLSHSNKQVFFLKMWTKKEAATKAVGLGFHFPFQHINTLETNQTLTINTQDVQQHLISTPQNEYIIALASVSPTTCQPKPWQELQYEWIKQCLI